MTEYKINALYLHLFHKGAKSMSTKNLFVLICLLLSFTIGVAHAAVQDGILVAHCFDDLIDNSGNGHVAVLGGDASISGGLLHLDGNGDYVDFGDIDALEFSVIFSLHDFDLSFFLKILKEAGKLDKARIIGIPLGYDEKEAIKAVTLSAYQEQSLWILYQIV